MELFGAWLGGCFAGAAAVLFHIKPPKKIRREALEEAAQECEERYRGEPFAAAIRALMEKE